MNHQLLNQLSLTKAFGELSLATPRPESCQIREIKKSKKECVLVKCHERWELSPQFLYVFEVLLFYSSPLFFCWSLTTCHRIIFCSAQLSVYLLVLCQFINVHWSLSSADWVLMDQFCLYQLAGMDSDDAALLPLTTSSGPFSRLRLCTCLETPVNSRENLLIVTLSWQQECSISHRILQHFPTTS